MGFVSSVAPRGRQRDLTAWHTENGARGVADLSDVEVALVGAVTGIVYPGGVSGGSVTGSAVRIYRGWPQMAPLSNDLAEGVANISVFPVPDATRLTTRWSPVAHATPGVPALSVTVNGNSARFGGAGGVGQVAGLLVANVPFVYRGQAGDTPSVVAAMLAQLVQAQRPCWLLGPSVTIPGVSSIIARVVADGAMVTEWARQEQGFRISAWCPDPMLRDTLCSAIGGALAATSFLTLDDGTSARIRFRSTASFDDDQDAQQYRRDLVYDIEYGTTVDASAPSMLFGDLMWSGTPFYG
jgi:hypothetical protein